MKRSASNVTPRGWGENCNTWELLSGQDLVVFHEQMPPATAEIEHYHNKARQFFFVLRGELSIRTMGSDHILREHEGLEVPAGELHLVRNLSTEMTEFLAIAHPSTVGDRSFPERES
jgi:quercetin dioxygenase-like cupin family protein